MKVAFFLGRFPLLSETFVLDQITGLIDRGHDVSVIAITRGDVTRAHASFERYGLAGRLRTAPTAPAARALRGVKAAGLFLLRGLRRPAVALRTLNRSLYGQDAASLRLFYAAMPLMGAHEFDVVCCHFGEIGVFCAKLRAAGVLRGKLATFFHGYDMSLRPEPELRQLYAPLFREGELMLPVSVRWHDRLVAWGCDPRKVRVHRMGVRTSEFTVSGRASDPGGDVRAVTVSRLVEKKGIEFGIRAVGLLRERCPRLIYDIVGGGPREDSLASLIRELGLSRQVRLLGPRTRDEVRNVLGRAHILLAPSVTTITGDQEGIPVSIMEGMSCGLPVVSTLHSGIPELVKHGVSGLLAPERDAEELARCLGRLVESPDERMRMGRAGRACVEQQFDEDRLNDELERIFREISESV